MKFTFYTLCLFFQVAPLLVGFSQNVEVIRTALKDELKRSMDGLEHPEYDKPFYISYQVDDYVSTSISANLGGIITSFSNGQRTVNGRVIVGSYDFNDESFASQNIEPYYGPDDARLPLENDYDALRRTLWSITDKIYKTAGEIYQSHKKELKNKEKPIEEIPHLKFSKEKPIQQTLTLPNNSFSREDLEIKMSEISGYFLKYPEIEVSGVNLNIYNGNNYFVSSEGSDYVEAKLFSTLNITAAAQDVTGNYVYSQKSYYAENAFASFDSLDFEKEILMMNQEVESLAVASKFDESYEGPVLFLEDAVPTLFESMLYQFVPSPPDQNGLNEFGADYGYDNSMETRLGKIDFPEALSVRLTPSLKSYEGKRLYGSYNLDREGVVPDEEIVLIESGKVNDLMVSRNYVSDELTANGTGSGPGVVHIEYADTKKDLSALKRMMIKELKKRKMEYGIIVKKLSNMQALGIYKFTVDGEEQLFKWARVSDFDQKSFRKIMSVVDQKVVKNMASMSGVTSYIIPEAILIDDVEIEAIRMPSAKQQEPLVPSPLSTLVGQN